MKPVVFLGALLALAACDNPPPFVPMYDGEKAVIHGPPRGATPQIDADYQATADRICVRHQGKGASYASSRKLPEGHYEHVYLCQPAVQVLRAASRPSLPLRP